MGFAYELIKRTQDRIAMWLAIQEPLIKTVQISDILSPGPIRNVIDAGDDGTVKADPHPDCTVRKVGIAGAEHGHTDGHVCTNGIIPTVNRNTAIDCLLAAFSVQCFVELEFCILQSTTLIKIGNGLADVY